MLDTIHAVCFVLVFTTVGFFAVIGALLLARVLSRRVLGEYYDPDYSIVTLVLPVPLWMLFWCSVRSDGGMWIHREGEAAVLGWRLSNSVLLTQVPQGWRWLLLAPVPTLLVFLWLSFGARERRPVAVSPWHAIEFSPTRGHPRWK